MLLIILCLFSIGHKKDSVASQMQDQKLQDGSFTELPRKLLQWYTIILICTQCFLFSSIVANYFSSSSAAGPHILMTFRRYNTIMIYTETASFRKNGVYLRSPPMILLGLFSTHYYCTESIVKGMMHMY